MPSWRDNRHIPEFNMNEVRDIIFQWLDLIAEQNVDRNYYKSITPDVVRDLKLAADKSHYLGRRFSGELHRTEKCPEHQGVWHGLEFVGERRCQYGCNLTGWLPRVKTIAEGVFPGVDGPH